MNLKELIPGVDLVFLTIDSLRYDVAEQAYEENLIPNLSKFIPHSGWEKRYTPASFTFPAHQAFFAGFLPTKIQEQITPRLFAAEFLGSTSVTAETYLFEQENIMESLEQEGYYTICIGGVGFFNKLTAVSRQIPNQFLHSHWEEAFGVTEQDSAMNQVEYAKQFFAHGKPLFLFINFSATHQPTHFYVAGAQEESVETQKMALASIDQAFGELEAEIKERGRDTLLIVCSDHGTAFGEDGLYGHRNGHEVVMTVPYFHKLITHD